jgi:hypothetical protein
MNRRAFVTGLGAVLAAPLAAEGQQAAKMYRLGVLALDVPNRYFAVAHASLEGALSPLALSAVTT